LKKPTFKRPSKPDVRAAAWFAPGAPLWSYGFRPFFLLAGAWAVATVLVLLTALATGRWPSRALPVTQWHGHEMLFGFVGAAIAGFLLTAVPTWTGTKPVSGRALAALVALWLLGRAVLAPWPGLNGTPWMLLEAAFFPALALAIAIPLIRTKNYRNLQFLMFLALLTLTDVFFLASALGYLGPSAADPLRFAANLVMLMITVVGGRIVPLFTRNALLRAGRKLAIAPAPWLDRAAVTAVVATILVDLVPSGDRLAGTVAGMAALLLGLRLARWYGHRTLEMPIVWSLHAGYAWIVVSLALKSAWLLAQPPWASNWLHALTAGAFGTMVLAVMTRVGLGHTGRELVVARPITFGYALVIIGAALRVGAAALPPQHYVTALIAAGAAWAAAFSVFLAFYAPILLAPRADQT
jgi:uncharacterized protein involved in response to NO